MSDQGSSSAEVLLLRAIKGNLAALVKLLDEALGHRQYEDGLYRFYPQSSKVHALQALTSRMVQALKHLVPDAGLNSYSRAIVAEGTGKAMWPIVSLGEWRRWLGLFHPQRFSHPL